MRVREMRAAIAEALAERAAERAGICPMIRPEIVAELAAHMARGNRKLPGTTAIMNMTAATDCPSMGLGLCPIPEGRCYALKAERAYPQCLPARRHMAAVTAEATAEEMAAAVAELAARFRVNAWRISEAGDFRSAADLAKVRAAADLVSESIDAGGLSISAVRPYVYTARADLFGPPEESALVVNGSGFLPNGGNEFRAVSAEALAEILAADHKALVCPGNCRHCAICSRAHGRIVYCPIH